MAWVDVCGVDDAFEDRINGYEVNGRRVLIMNAGGRLTALDGTCTHEDAELGAGFLVDGRITCPLHLSQFDAVTGAVFNPPAERGLEAFPVKAEGGRVLVDLP